MSELVVIDRQADLGEGGVLIGVLDALQRARKHRQLVLDGEIANLLQVIE